MVLKFREENTAVSRISSLILSPIVRNFARSQGAAPWKDPPLENQSAGTRRGAFTCRLPQL
jgi:hypothetical protein